MDASWTISELCERVAEALSASDELPGGKARAIPDERSIRYYTTLGLIDRATLRGRTAYYGARHLAQLVAIKKMQADGATLAEIQALLPAIDDARLSELTGVAIGAAVKPPARRDFWRTGAMAGGAQAASEPARPWGRGTGAAAAAPTPSEMASAAAAPIGPTLAAGSGSTAAAEHVVDATAAVAPPPSFTAEPSLELAPGVRLTISAARTPNDADADALRSAAAAVLAELARRRLVTLPPGRQP